MFLTFYRVKKKKKLKTWEVKSLKFNKGEVTHLKNEVFNLVFVQSINFSLLSRKKLKANLDMSYTKKKWSKYYSILILISFQPVKWGSKLRDP